MDCCCKHNRCMTDLAAPYPQRGLAVEPRAQARGQSPFRRTPCPRLGLGWSHSAPVDYERPRRKADVRDGLSNTFLLGEDVPRYDIYCSWPYANNVHSTCAIPPNYNEHADPTDWPNVQSFRSEHAGGLHFALADGSLRFISNSIDLELYRALATIAGREVVSTP